MKKIIVKYFFIKAFCICKMTTNYYQKYKERIPKKHVKDMKIFQKKKKTKGKKKVGDRYQILTEKQKQKPLQYMKKYYLADPRAIKFLSWTSP